MSDVVERAKAALVDLHAALKADLSPIEIRTAEALRSIIQAVPDLIAEIEQLRQRLGALQVDGVEEFAALQVLRKRDRDAVAAELARIRGETSRDSVSPVPASPNPPDTRTSAHSPHSGPGTDTTTRQGCQRMSEGRKP